MAMNQNTKRLFFVLLALLVATLACGRSQEAAPDVQEPATQEATEPVAEPEQSQPADSAQVGDILFEDDFQDGQPDDWEITAAWDVQQSGDVYTFNASGSGGAWVPAGRNWGNYALTTAARLDAGSLLLSINLSQDGRYLVRLDENGLYLVKESPAQNYTVVAQTGPVTLGEWHQVDAMAYNGHIQVYVEDELWIDYTDSAPLSRGSIAVTAQDGSQVAVDDVLVTKTGPLPEGVVQAPPPLDVEVEMEMEDGDVVIIEPDAAAQDQPDAEQPQDAEDPPEEEPSQSSGLPDLVVVEATFDPDPAIQGEQFMANYVISNQGDAPSGAFTLLWKFHAATGMGVCSWDYDSLEPGETVWGGCPRMTNADPGQSPTTLTVDVDGEVIESDEDNNELAPTLTLITTAQDEHGESGGGESEDGELPDLVIESIKLTADDTIRCDVRNLGSGDAPGGVRLTLFIDGERIEWQEIEPIIQSGTANSIWFSNLTLDLPVEARCIADRGNSIEESNDANNTLTVTLAPE